MSTNRRQIILGVDAGGTFTDFVLLQLEETPIIRIHKVASTPAAPEQAVLQGITELGLADEINTGKLKIIHGSTVATNAALEGKGARTALVTNYGFGDMLTLARQTRPTLYALEFDPIPQPVDEELRFETGGRISAAGELLEPLDSDCLDKLTKQIATHSPEAVCINLLFSFLDDQYEKRIEAAIAASFPDLYVCRSSAVLPEYKEYERGITTWLNATLGPLVSRYLHRLQSELANCSLHIMQSSGETCSADAAAAMSVNLLLSGPAGGMAAVKYLSRNIAQDQIISFDMGGTSTDVALFQGDIIVTNEGSIAHYPVATPMVDLHTIGAGGGSIAYLDDGGMLRVGPRSAGADPGPACYGRGGVEPTVTDANLLLGRIQSSAALAGSLALDKEKSQAAIRSLSEKIGLNEFELAQGIIGIANENMAAALRKISVQKGHDPREYLLASFGGAGGLHVCDLADLIGVKSAIVPIHGGVLSALGMIVAEQGKQLSHTINLPLTNDSEEAIEAAIKLLLEKAQDSMRDEGLALDACTQTVSVDVRYVGQSYTLNVNWFGCAESLQLYHQSHESRYGYRLGDSAEIVNIRVKIASRSCEPILPLYEPNRVNSGQNSRNNSQQVQVYGLDALATVIDRASMPIDSCIHGPAVITEFAATTWVGEHWTAALDAQGNIRLQK